MIKFSCFGLRTTNFFKCLCDSSRVPIFCEDILCSPTCLGDSIVKVVYFICFFVGAVGISEAGLCTISIYGGTPLVLSLLKFVSSASVFKLTFSWRDIFVLPKTLSLCNTFIFFNSLRVPGGP